LKRRYGFATLRFGIPNKAADLNYIAAEALNHSLHECDLVTILFFKTPSPEELDWAKRTEA